MRPICFVLLIVAGFSSCSMNTTYNNRESDKQDAERVAEQLYHFLKANEPQKAMSLFSPKFFSATDTNRLYQLLDTAKIVNGSIESYILANWQTNIVKGTDTRSDYVLVYVVRRERKDTQETILFEKEGESIKITGYNMKW